MRVWGQLRHYFSLAGPKVHVSSWSRELDPFQRNKRLQGQYLISQFAGSCVFFASSKTTPKHVSAPPGQVTWAPREPPAVIGPLNARTILSTPGIAGMTMDSSELDPFDAEEDAPESYQEVPSMLLVQGDQNL